MTISLKDRVAIVTGAGGGLGRAHALALAARGAKVVVNDLGATDVVVAEIVAAGGEAFGHSASVTDAAAVHAMVAQVMERWGRVDILVNNAGILRDKTFAKMSLEDFRTVVDVHLMGAVNCTSAVWQIMRDRNYGRVVMTSSSSGLYGNFGQSNYGAAKMALVGIMQTIGMEGAKYNVHVNCLAPTGATAMTEGILSAELMAQLAPDRVSPGVVFLASEQAPNRTILLAGAGSFEVAHVTMSQGMHVGTGADAADRLAALWDKVSAREGSFVPDSGLDQGKHEVGLLLAGETV